MNFYFINLEVNNIYSELSVIRTTFRFTQLRTYLGFHGKFQVLTVKNR